MMQLTLDYTPLTGAMMLWRKLELEVEAKGKVLDQQ